MIFAAIAVNINASVVTQKTESFTQEYAEAINLIVAQRYEEGIPMYERNIRTLREMNAPADEIALWQKGLGTCKLYTGKVGDAEKIYLDAVHSLDDPKYKNEKIVRQLFDALSVLYTQTQNLEKAALYSDKAKTLYEENLDFGDDYVRCLSNNALVYAEMGYNTVAKTLVDVALRQTKSNLNNKTQIAEIVEETTFLKTTDFRDNAYITFRIMPYITLLNNASYIYQLLGYYTDAITAVKEAIKVAEEYKLSEPMPYNSLGLLYFAKSKFKRASEWFQKSYAMCRVPYEKDHVGLNSALCLFLSNNPAAPEFCTSFSSEIRENIHDMFAFMSGSERAIYWKHYEDFLPMLNLIIYECGQSNGYGAIYDNILEAKGLLLRSTNAIRDAIFNSGNESDLNDYHKVYQLKQRLLVESNDSVRAAINQKIERLDKRLTEHVSSYMEFISAKSIKWEDVRNALSDDDIAIEFYNIPNVWGRDSIQTLNSEPRYCAVTLKKDYTYPKITPLCKESQLANIDKEDYYETDSIFNLIWKPLVQELKGVRNIYFAADRDLHKIGIEYVLTSDEKRIEDKYNLYRVSSTRVLAEVKSGGKTYNAVLYGGLRYDMAKEELIAESRSGDFHPVSASRAISDANLRYGVKYLPATMKEVEEIAQEFVNKPRLVTDVSGTEESFKSLNGTSLDIIHLATHGFFWSNEDAENRKYVTFLKHMDGSHQSEEDKALMRSGLLFSGANIGLKGEPLPNDVEDGVLTALELSNLNLGNVDMVVMSTCESGLGETSGEGVFGLQRGFKLAGANTLLMSLWKVDDEATKILMVEFYKNYLLGKTKRESLHLAQQSLRNTPQYSDPEYWAAFILLDGIN